jgi:hypothetical protein
MFYKEYRNAFNRAMKTRLLFDQLVSTGILPRGTVRSNNIPTQTRVLGQSNHGGQMTVD